MAWIFHEIGSGFTRHFLLMLWLFLRYKTSTMHNLSHWRITLQSHCIKEVIRAAGPAAEITDNALQQLLNWGVEGGGGVCKKIRFPHHLKGKCNYLWTNQHLALTSCAWPCWTRNHGNFSSPPWSPASLNRDLSVCVCGYECHTQPVFHVFLSPGHRGIQSHPALYGFSYCVQITNMQGWKSSAAPNTQKPSIDFSYLAANVIFMSWSDKYV